MTMPKRLTLHSSAFALDGGTTSLTGTDERGRQHNIILAQRARAKMHEFTRYVPGRLYFDAELVPVRSQEERLVLDLLRAADVRYVPRAEEEAGEQIKLSPKALILGDDIKQVLSRGPEENIRALLAQVIERVESPQYESFAAEVDRVNGRTARNG